jgi:hypothetical protein
MPTFRSRLFIPEDSFVLNNIQTNLLIEFYFILQNNPACSKNDTFLKIILSDKFDYYNDGSGKVIYDSRKLDINYRDIKWNKDSICLSKVDRSFKV